MMLSGAFTTAEADFIGLGLKANFPCDESLFVKVSMNFILKLSPTFEQDDLNIREGSSMEDRLHAEVNKFIFIHISLDS